MNIKRYQVRQSRIRPKSVLGIVGVVALLSAGCAAEDQAQEGDTTAPDVAAEDAGAAATGDDEATAESSSDVPDTEFTLAFPGIPGTSDVAIQATIDDLKERGYNADTAVLAEPELAAEGLARGEFQIMVGGGVSALIAIQQGAPVKMIGSRAGNEWALISATDINECADLDGRRLGIHSEGGTSTAMVRAYVDENCPGTKPDYVIVSGSGNRAQAMQAGELDASPLELGDIINLEAAGELEFNTLANLIEDLPKLVNAAFYANTDFAESNPELMTEIVRTQLEIHRRINDDPEYMMELMGRYLPDVDEETARAISERYVELEIFASDGGLYLDHLEWTLGFFESNEFMTGDIPTAEEASDLSYLEGALAALEG